MRYPYLNKFNNKSEYDEYIDSDEAMFPNVGVIESDGNVKYQKEKHNYANDYLTFTALEDTTFTLNVPATVTSSQITSVSYSLDNGKTWTDTLIDSTNQNITTPTILAGDSVLWKGTAISFGKSVNYGSTFSSTGTFNISGNIMSLLYGDNYINSSTLNSYSFVYLFKNSKVVSAKKLIMPASTAKYCCYYGMFESCTSLQTAPELPAKWLETSCYQRMFRSCTSLTTAPVLPATNILGSSYSGMFANCSSLNYIKVLATQGINTSNTESWVYEVSATGTFVKAEAASWPEGSNGIPTGWTVQTASE